MKLITLFQELRHIYQRAENEGLSIRLHQVPSRVFNSKMVLSTEVKDKALVVRLNFWGMYGGLGGLPDYFTDEILRDRDGRGGLQDFLDIFNHRFLDGLFLIWRKYQIFLENGVDARHATNQEFDLFLRSIAGVLSERSETPLFLRCLRRHHFALFQKREKTMLGLNALLYSFFPNLTLELGQHAERYIRIPDRQRAVMKRGSGLNIGVSGNVLVGARIRDINGMFSLTVKDLDYESYLRLLPRGDWYGLLSGLVHEYSQGQWECELTLELRPSEIPDFKLGGGQMGINVWVKSKVPDQPAVINVGKLAS